MAFSTPKKLLLLGVIVVLLIAIPLTIYLLQQQQITTSKATPSTRLYFTPPSQPIKVGDTVRLDVMMDPGQNIVNFAKLTFTFEPSKLTPVTTGTECGSSICPNTQVFPATLEGPTITSNNISITLSIGADTTKLIQTVTKIATLTFQATGSGTTQIRFAPDPQTQVLSSRCTPADPTNCPDQFNENVISSQEPISLTIADAAPTPTLTSAPQAANQAPACTSLNVDRTTSGTAPFSITFTANGTDTNGTIQKVTFDFGDGPVQDTTQGGGIGSNTVSVQVAHTYNNPGTYKASAILTDNNNATSTPATCAQTITVTQGSSGNGTGTSTPSATIIPTATTAPIVNQPTATREPLPSSGPGETFIGVGLAGAALSIIGAMIFFAL